MLVEQKSIIQDFLAERGKSGRIRPNRSERTDRKCADSVTEWKNLEIPEEALLDP